MNNVAVAVVVLAVCISPLFAEENTPPLNAFADRSYYTTEENAEIFWNGRGAENDSPSSVQVTTDSGKILTRKGKPGIDKSITVPLKDFPSGIHMLSLELKYDERSSVRCSVEVVKRDPKPGHEWKIDRINRVLLKEGKPHFPYGMIMYAMAVNAGVIPVRVAG